MTKCIACNNTVDKPISVDSNLYCDKCYDNNFVKTDI